MIKRLPKIYPDESIYSFLARAFVQSGYLYHKHFTKEIFTKADQQLDYNFMNQFNDVFYHLLDNTIGIKELLLNHTLFKYYVRFMSKEKRHKVYEIGIENKIGLERLLPIAVNKSKQYLRCCPMCMKEDREKYGEAYFHISHQIPEPTVCSIHKCKLVDTSIQNQMRNDSIFVPLELVGKSKRIEMDEGINYEVSKYITDIFELDLDFDHDVKISDFLESWLESQYFFDKTKGKRMKKLLEDMDDFYKDLDTNNLKRSRLNNLFFDKDSNAYDQYLMAFFEGIPVKTFENINLNGFNRKRRKQKNQHYRSGRDWPLLDKVYCEEFEEKRKKASEKSKVLSAKTVALLLGIKDKRLRHLPMLRKMIRNQNCI